MINRGRFLNILPPSSNTPTNPLGYTISDFIENAINNNAQ